MKESSRMLVSDEIIIPIKSLCYMYKQDASTYYAGIIMNESITWRVVSKGAYDQMMENMSGSVKYKQEIEILKHRIQLLEQYISLMPGGSEYLLAEQDFTQNSNEQKKECVTAEVPK